MAITRRRIRGFKTRCNAHLEQVNGEKERKVATYAEYIRAGKFYE